MVSSRKFSEGLLLFCVFFFPNVVSPVSTELNVRHSSQVKLRVKRQECQDGTYEHGGINCCKCAAGQRLEEHCTETASYGKCVFCEDGTYNSEPSSKDSCEICTSCGPENANLEEDRPCTTIQDRTCRCKKGHYCNTAEGTCKICHPCTRCSSIKEHCTATTDTVCNEESTGLSGGAVAGIVIAVLFFVAALGVVVFRKNILGFFKRDTSNSPGPVNDPLLPVEMEPHIVDVAEIIGWKDMRQIALGCQMANSIENVKLSHPNDSEMWTQELLNKWVELKGRPASVELIATLRKMGKNNKADKIKEKLYPIDSPAQLSSA
ncbi:tumor necrosis factor receptor superfamily member 6-like [Xiphophorus maculatus]|uniref:Tumor necrosis factor receptor superfamily member 6-like n=1 Tax=Xiphophorus maculatus TaxID=8083 RepID=A0A3B5PYL1_XIPMA|nr:tumor necrosis factor receptor superfamily member 6-like [Xiphophorus maculatus]